MIILKSKAELEIMKIAGRIVAGAHALVARSIRVGITTMELDRLVEEYIHTVIMLSLHLKDIMVFRQAYVLQ